MTSADEIPQIPVAPEEIPPEVVGPISDEQLMERLGEVLQSTTDIRREMVVENHKRDVRIRNSRAAIVLALLVAVISIAVGKSAQNDAHRANKAAQRASAALTKSLANTQEARIASCKNDNVKVQRNAKKDQQNFDDFIDVLVSSANGNGRPPPDPVLIQKIKDRQHAAIQKASEISFDNGGLRRDCTLAGIQRYLTQKP